MAKLKEPSPNPAGGLIMKILAEQAEASARIKRLLDKYDPNLGRARLRRLNRKIQEEITLLERNTAILAARASDKSTLTGVARVARMSASFQLVVKRLSGVRKHRLLLSNQRKILRDYSLVYKDLSKRLDTLIINGVTQRRLTSTLTKRVETALRQESIQTDLLRELLKDEVVLISKTGRRYQPLEYAKLVARTRTREFMSTGLEAQMKNNNFPFYQVSKHKSPPNEPMDEPCKVIEGNIYSYPRASKAAKEKHPVAPWRVPVHPRCKHSETPWLREAA